MEKRGDLKTREKHARGRVMYRKFKHPFLLRELYRRINEVSITRAFGENLGLASAGWGDTAVGSA
jgi:hypothetical protein